VTAPARLGRPTDGRDISQQADTDSLRGASEDIDPAQLLSTRRLLLLVPAMATWEAAGR
jgi:hypothetical protein